MLKIRKKDPNVIVLGLTHENLDRLRAGQPIKFNLRELELEDCACYIMAAKDDAELVAPFINQIGADTQIIDNHTEIKPPKP